jgi:alkylated DNA repair dioxygenase AlkB
MDTIELLDGGILVYDQDFLPEERAQKYFAELKEHCQWEQVPASCGYLQSRWTATYGDEGVTYLKSGIVKPALPWTPTLLEIKSQIEAVQGRFNYCELCLYKSGPDNVAWHADDDPGMGNVIGSLSLGATRKFRIRHIVKRNPRSFIQGNGTLIIMAGTMQQFWQHEVQNSKENVGERMKLTFRFVGEH